MNVGTTGAFSAMNDPYEIYELQYLWIDRMELPNYPATTCGKDE